jgi:hypothetical protein
MVLDAIIKQKVFFNPNKKEHVKHYAEFLETGAWGTDGCPFILEFPYLSVPYMCKDKLVHKMLKVKAIETYADRYQH